MLRLCEIEEELDIADDIKVLTPHGWRKILKVYRTVPLKAITIRTLRHELTCAYDHLVLSGGKLILAKNLNTDSIVDCDTGAEKVIEIIYHQEKIPLYDITVDDPSGLFFSNGIVSHNSTTLIARQLMNCFLLPGYKCLYVTPLHEQVSTTGDRMMEMESAFRANTGKLNKYSKTYQNRSGIDLLHCLESGNAARGKSTTENMYDEAQGLDPNIIPEIEKTQSQSEVPMSIYAGTALSTDTLLETMWQASSFGMWHIRAKDGKHWLNMYDKKTLFEVCDNPAGPTCPYTGLLLDVTDGCFIHANERAYEAGDIGIHVPQCIVPDNLDVVKWGKIYKEIKRQDPKKTLQENFGIAVSEGAREITQKELEAICVLTDTKLLTLEKIRTGYYQIIVSGCDWGGSDYNPATKTKSSYTVHVILGLAPDGCVDILHFRRYSGMGYREIIRDIIADHKAYNARVIASDYGVGAVYSMLIRELIPWMQHFIMQLSSPNTAAFKAASNSELANHYMVNKTEAVTSVFQAIKDVQIRAKNWEDTSPYLLDFLNLFRVPSETASGETKFLWIKPAQKADDALMATAFAYVLIKLYKHERIIEDKSIRAHVNAILTGQTMPSILTMNPEVFFG